MQSDERKISRIARLNKSKKLNEGRLILSGEVLRINHESLNDRVFTKSAVAKALLEYDLLNAEQSDWVVVGEFEHPECAIDDCDERVERYRTRMRIPENLFLNSDSYSDSNSRVQNVSHIVRGLYFNGSRDSVDVVVEVIEQSEAGREVKEIYENGGVVGASVRAWGVSEEDFELITVDLVRQPAQRCAFLQPHLVKYL